LCIGIIPKKDRPKEGETKWFDAKRALGSFHGVEEEVERGKG
jgi:hypothetical protein